MMNKTFKGSTLYFLKDNDIIHKDCYIRSLYEVGLTYKPDDYNKFMWQPVTSEIPAWIGKAKADIAFFGSCEIVYELN